MSLATSVQFPVWFIHPGYEPPLPLKLERLPERGVRIIGGKSGSHIGSHGESYWDKLVEIIKLGYIPADIAVDLGKLSRDWTPPQEEELDNMIESGAHVLKGR